jgi:hypothetical protein
MIASKFPRINLYHIRFQPTRVAEYTNQKVCSYHPMIVVQSNLRQQEYKGAIINWQVYQLEPHDIANTDLNSSWRFLDERCSLEDIDVLYIRLLASI